MLAFVCVTIGVAAAMFGMSNEAWEWFLALVGAVAFFQAGRHFVLARLRYATRVLRTEVERAILDDPESNPHTVAVIPIVDALGWLDRLTARAGGWLPLRWLVRRAQRPGGRGEP